MRKPYCRFSNSGGNTQAILDTVYAAFDREGMQAEKEKFMKELTKCTCSGQIYKLVKERVISPDFVTCVEDFFK